MKTADFKNFYHSLGTFARKDFKKEFLEKSGLSYPTFYNYMRPNFKIPKWAKDMIHKIATEKHSNYVHLLCFSKVESEK